MRTASPKWVQQTRPARVTCQSADGGGTVPVRGGLHGRARPIKARRARAHRTVHVRACYLDFPPRCCSDLCTVRVVQCPLQSHALKWTYLGRAFGLYAASIRQSEQHGENGAKLLLFSLCAAVGTMLGTKKMSDAGKSRGQGKKQSQMGSQRHDSPSLMPNRPAGQPQKRDMCASEYVLPRAACMGCKAVSGRLISGAIGLRPSSAKPVCSTSG